VIALCDRWNKLPEEILAMDASGLRLLEIIRLGKGEEVTDDAE